MRKLAELGYVEGRNLLIERKFAQGNAGQLKEFATELVRQQVDVIVTVGTLAGFAAKEATKRSLSFSAPSAIRLVSASSQASCGPVAMQLAIH